MHIPKTHYHMAIHKESTNEEMRKQRQRPELTELKMVSAYWIY